jgi:hypothetical protein
MCSSGSKESVRVWIREGSADGLGRRGRAGSEEFSTSSCRRGGVNEGRGFSRRLVGPAGIGRTRMLGIALDDLLPGRGCGATVSADIKGVVAEGLMSFPVHAATTAGTPMQIQAFLIAFTFQVSGSAGLADHLVRFQYSAAGCVRSVSAEQHRRADSGFGRYIRSRLWLHGPMCRSGPASDRASARGSGTSMMMVDLASAGWC